MQPNRSRRLADRFQREKAIPKGPLQVPGLPVLLGPGRSDTLNIGRRCPFQRLTRLNANVKSRIIRRQSYRQTVSHLRKAETLREPLPSTYLEFVVRCRDPRHRALDPV